MRTVTLWGTSNSGTIPGVGTPDFSTGLRSKSTTSTWNSSPQRELTANPLSGKLGADQSAAPARRRTEHPDQQAAGLHPCAAGSSADDAKGQLRGAAALHQPGDLTPVEVVGVDLGQQHRDAEPGELCHSPGVHGQLVV